jgi:hypothetical protein
MRQRASCAVALVCKLDGRLQHCATGAIHVELAARKPAEVGGIGRVKQQQRRLAAFRVQIEDHAPVLFFEAKFKSRLPRDVLDELAIELEQQQFVGSRLQYLHCLLF